QENNIESVVIGETYVISPSVVSSSHITMNRGANPRFIPAVKTPADFVIPITAVIPAQMNLSVTNGVTLAGGASNPGYFNTLDYSGSEDITIIKGKHQTQLGAQYIRAYMHAQNTRGVNGNLNFTGQFSTVGGVSGLGY